MRSRTTHRGRRFASLIVVAGLAIAACGGDDDTDTTGPGDVTTPSPDETDDDVDDTPDTDTPEPDTPEPDADDGAATPSPDADECASGGDGAITVAVPSLASTLDPYSASGDLGGAMMPFYDVLVAYDATTGDYVPRLAETIESNDDATVWTLTLREGVTFGSGNPLDAAAVKASIDRHFAEGSESAVQQQRPLIAAVEAVDDLTVEFTLTGPWGAFPIALSRGIGYIVDLAEVDARGEEYAMDPAGGGAGAYEVRSFSPPDSLVYVAKDDWWGGTPCIETITFTVIPDATAARDAFTTGEIDAALIDARDPVNSARAKADAANSATYVQHGGGILLLNQHEGEVTPPFVDPRVRAAIALAIDPDVVDERAWEGLGYPQDGLIQEASQVYDATEGPGYDPDRARELLAEYQAETGWDASVRFDCVGNLADAAISLAAMLEAVGFEVDLDPNRTLGQQVQLVIFERNFDIACFGHTPEEADLWDGLRGYQAGSPMNFSGYADERMDAALEELRQATDVADVQTIIERIQDIWNETNPAVVYGAFEHVYVWHDHITGLDFNYSTTVVGIYDGADVTG